MSDLLLLITMLAVYGLTAFLMVKNDQSKEETEEMLNDPDCTL